MSTPACTHGSSGVSASRGPVPCPVCGQTITSDSCLKCALQQHAVQSHRGMSTTQLCEAVRDVLNAESERIVRHEDDVEYHQRKAEARQTRMVLATKEDDPVKKFLTDWFVKLNELVKRSSTSTNRVIDQVRSMALEALSKHTSEQKVLESMLHVRYVAAPEDLASKFVIPGTCFLVANVNFLAHQLATKTLAPKQRKTIDKRIYAAAGATMPITSSYSLGMIPLLELLDPVRKPSTSSVTEYLATFSGDISLQDTCSFIGAILPSARSLEFAAQDCIYNLVKYKQERAYRAIATVVSGCVDAQHTTNLGNCVVLGDVRVDALSILSNVRCKKLHATAPAMVEECFVDEECALCGSVELDIGNVVFQTVDEFENNYHTVSRISHCVFRGLCDIWNINYATNSVFLHASIDGYGSYISCVFLNLTILPTFTGKFVNCSIMQAAIMDDTIKGGELSTRKSSRRKLFYAWQFQSCRGKGYNFLASNYVSSADPQSNHVPSSSTAAKLLSQSSRDILSPLSYTAYNLDSLPNSSLVEGSSSQPAFDVNSARTKELPKIGTGPLPAHR